MDYSLSRLRMQLAGAVAEKLSLSVDEVVVMDARPGVEADLAIPMFALAKKLDRNPQDLAKALAEDMAHDLIESSSEAGGYINLKLAADKLANEVLAEAGQEKYGHNLNRQGQHILIEHTDPNPFKELHIGHLYSNTIGESLARLFEASGAELTRLSYHGDVGLHVAKAIWAIGQAEDWSTDNLDEVAEGKDIGDFYTSGTRAYEESESAKTEIIDINAKVYNRSDEVINAIYDWGFEKSFKEFERVYSELGVKAFDKRYLESQTGPVGLKIVEDNRQNFELSEGAWVYRAEQEGEHTRVFVNSQGLPTYEAKELGLAVLKNQDYPEAEMSVVVTANEISAYFRVVMKVLEKLNPEIAGKTRHVTHGLVKLPEGKMSSRTGSVIKAEQLLEEVTSAVASKAPESPAIRDNALGAIKYAFLKNNIGGDVVFDINESIRLEGQTGPYIQYAHVRISSIIAKAGGHSRGIGEYDWQTEKSLLVMLARYPEAVEQATTELAPNKIAAFLYELAKEFNRYYEQNPILKAEEPVKSARLVTIEAVGNTLKNGLALLNIPSPEKM